MGSKKKEANEDADDRKRHEQPLQAVLLAEDWKVDFDPFHPLDFDVPKALFPILNRPILDYEIEYLVSQGVQELYVVCVSSAVENYLTEKNYGISLFVIRDPTLTNAGDALREVDKRNVISSDPFVLMNADTITNIEITRAMKEHKERRETDSSAIFTMVLTQSTTSNTIIGMDPQNRVLLYDEKSDYPKIPCSFFHVESIIVKDNLDDILYVCSPDVLARVSDEFDYRDIRKEFIVNSVAEEEEGLQNRIYGYFGTGYGKRITNPKTFHSVSRELLRRQFQTMLVNYKLCQNFCYLETTGKLRIAKTANILGPGTMIGPNCFVADNCTIQCTVLGAGCHVSESCSIKNSYLWQDVQVGKNVVVTNSILSNDVVLKDNVVVQNAVIGAGCVIGENTNLPKFARLTISNQTGSSNDDDGWGDEDDDHQTEETSEIVVVSDADIVGPDGIGYIWKPEYDSDDEEDADMILQSQCIGSDDLPKRTIVETDDFSVQDEFDEPEYDDNVTFDSPMVIGQQEGVDVLSELKNICLEFEQANTGSPIENLAIELNSYKFSQNASYSDCTHAATLAILELIDLKVPLSKLVEDFRSTLDRWAPLLQKMSIGTTEEKEIVLALEKYVIANGVEVMRFRLLLQTLHDEEIVSEEAILEWAKSRKTSKTDEAQKQLFDSQPVQAFLEWLEEEEEDDDESEEESD